jgi:hypothetical protein
MTTQSNGSWRETQGPQEETRRSKIRTAITWLMDNSDAILKLTGTLGIVAATLLVSSYESRMSAISLINQREQAESELRASMFSHLITPVAGPQRDNQEIDSHRERVLVELLALNFHEHFEFKPLMMHVDKRLAKISVSAKLADVRAQAQIDRNSLQSIARRVAERQIAMMAKEEESYEPFELEVTFPLQQDAANQDISNFFFKGDLKRLFVHPAGDQSSKDAEQQAFDLVFIRLVEHEIIEKVGSNGQYIFIPDDEQYLHNKLIAADLTAVSDDIINLWRQKQNKLTVLPTATNMTALPHQFVRLRPPASATESHFLELSLHSPNIDNRTVDIDYLVNYGDVAAEKAPRQFTLTWYDFPLTDNSLLPDGNRFSMVLSNFDIDEENNELLVRIKIVWYPKDYFTARERPIKYREFREKLNI